MFNLGLLKVESSKTHKGDLLLTFVKQGKAYAIEYRLHARIKNGAWSIV